MEQPNTLPQPVDTPPAKKAGRPKGSKNKGKAKRATTIKTPAKDVVRQVPKKGKLKYWERRSNALRERGTTPRDLYGRDEDPFGYSAPKEVLDNVHFMWMSDPVWQRNLPMPGFNRGMYEPVGPELMKELKLDVRTKDRTIDGVPKVGEDAWMMCCPMDLYQEQAAIQRGKPLDEILKNEQEESETKMVRAKGTTEPLGGHEVSRDINDITQKEADYKNVGSPF